MLAIMLSHSIATARFDGRGNPWLIIVDPRATMGLLAAIAADTSAEYLIALFMVITIVDVVKIHVHLSQIVPSIFHPLD